MAAIDDLTQSVANLQATTDQVVAKIDELKSQGNDAAVSAAAAAIDEAVAKLNGAIA